MTNAKRRVRSLAAAAIVSAAAGVLFLGGATNATASDTSTDPQIQTEGAPGTSIQSATAQEGSGYFFGDDEGNLTPIPADYNFGPNGPDAKTAPASGDVLPGYFFGDDEGNLTPIPADFNFGPLGPGAKGTPLAAKDTNGRGDDQALAVEDTNGRGDDQALAVEGEDTTDPAGELVIEPTSYQLPEEGTGPAGELVVEPTFYQLPENAGQGGEPTDVGATVTEGNGYFFGDDEGNLTPIPVDYNFGANGPDAKVTPAVGEAR